MSRVITAPSMASAIYPSVFLAGGITNCPDWQSEVINALDCERIALFNPRREKFNITDPDSVFVQIAWEYDRLESMDIFSMYFCGGESDQPICMYELGRNIVRMQNRFPSDWQKRIIVSIEDGYKRAKDVVIQMQLCAPTVGVNISASPESHAQCIKRAVVKLIHGV